MEAITSCGFKEMYNHLVALRSALTPAQQRVSLWASMATQQHVEAILGPDNNKIQTAEGRKSFHLSSPGAAVVSRAFVEFWREKSCHTADFFYWKETLINTLIQVREALWVSVCVCACVWCVDSLDGWQLSEGRIILVQRLLTFSCKDKRAYCTSLLNSMLSLWTL